MNIAIISKASKLGGGASQVAMDLVKVLKSSDHFVKHYRRDLEHGFTQDSSCVYGKYEKFAKKSFYKLKYFGFQEIIPWEYLHLKEEIKKHKFDLIHFHDLTTAISPLTLILLSKHIPVVWTLHDTSGFTGGCINPFGCEEFKNNCHPCPQKNNWPFGGLFDLAFLFRNIKKRVHASEVTIVSPSEWLAKEAYKSSIVNKKINILPNPVDTQTFINIDKQKAKQDLFINPNEFTILLAAGTVTSETKGFQYALKILKTLNPKDFTLILVGKLNTDDIRIFKNFKYVASGFTTDKVEINKYFSAADTFLNCSLGDNFPLVILESLSSGTPVIGFNTGGIKEMIIQNETGYLSNTYETEPICNKLHSIMKTKEYESWSKNARNYAKEHCSEETFLQNHLNLYTQLINKQKVAHDEKNKSD
jgi:glycosyltransferase involved in cell wall biosynthesis